MSAPAHTPGPWFYEFNPNFDLHPRVMANHQCPRICIASTIGTKTTRDLLTTEEKAANARLIAAAPALLSALEVQEMADNELANHGDTPVYQTLKRRAVRLRDLALARTA